MDAQLEIEELLESASMQWIQQQNNPFPSLAEAQKQRDKVKSKMRYLIEHGNRTLAKGLTFLSHDNQGADNGYVAKTCAGLLKHVGSPKQFSQVVESTILNNEDSLSLFIEAVEKFVECGDLEQEQCVLIVLLSLFPHNPQPYIFLGSSIWRNDGIDAAAAFYEEVLNTIPNPVIYYFAADCYYKIGDKDRARELLQVGLTQARNLPDLYGDIEQLIAEFLHNI